MGRHPRTSARRTRKFFTLEKTRRDCCLGKRPCNSSDRIKICRLDEKFNVKSRFRTSKVRLKLVQEHKRNLIMLSYIVMLSIQPPKIDFSQEKEIARRTSRGKIDILAEFSVNREKNVRAPGIFIADVWLIQVVARKEKEQVPKAAYTYLKIPPSTTTSDSRVL